MDKEKKKVLFLCTGNSARSQMAESILRNLADDIYEAHSAGLDVKEIHPLTLKVLEEIGIDVEGLYAKPLTLYLGKVPFHYVITVCDQADKNCPTIFPGMGERMHWSFEDPAAFEGNDEEKLKVFRTIRDQIMNRIKEFINLQKN